MGKLTALKVKSLSEPGSYSDGDGLMLVVRPSGSKNWIMRITIAGKRRDIGLGSYKTTTLADAREAADEMRRKVARGIDPLAERRAERIVIPTFQEAAKAVHEEHKAAWKNGKHQDQWLTTLKTYAFPALGKKLVSEIEGPAIRDVLASIWIAKPETARRVRQRIGAVLDWSYAKGFRATEAPMRSLSKGLPRQPKKDGHFEAMPYPDVPAFIIKLRERSSMGAVGARSADPHRRQVRRNSLGRLGRARPRCWPLVDPSSAHENGSSSHGAALGRGGRCFPSCRKASDPGDGSRLLRAECEAADVRHDPAQDTERLRP
ncbi:putative recombinase [Sphingomonas changbaiensis NBRC 104936]|uniref:Putative recombinase n=1 Tax=Sphingomonas changbaiensis NBRC 104936 TaxID=1219043 RepID=A0A0E9MN93_9SPHN|nr:putative recombinase [Sphingomonas changbaiensis NBRC 104936]